MRRLSFMSVVLAAIIVLALSTHAAVAVQDAPEYGPAKGTLVIVGGGSMDGTGVIE